MLVTPVAYSLFDDLGRFFRTSMSFGSACTAIGRLWESIGGLLPSGGNGRHGA